MKNNSKKTFWVISLVVSLLVVAGLSVYLYIGSRPTYTDSIKESVTSDETSNSSIIQTTENIETTTLAKNPFNYKKYHKINNDLFAWVYVPGTDVDHIVARPGKGVSDSFYLSHDYEGNYKFAGTIYCEKKNSTDFSDPVTVLYGHNMLDGSMMATLHKYEDEDFYNNNRYIYIYTKNHILTYKIFAATKYSNRHILNTFDFDNKDEIKDFINDIYSYADESGYCSTDIDVTENDKILVLSTCGNNSNFRYIVTGVLENDELTQ